MIKLSKKDFEDASPILIIHQPGAGGKTVSNLLALGSNAVFQDRLSIKMQQLGDFSSEKKLKFLLSKFDKSKAEKTWNDLGMGEPYFLTPDFKSPILDDYSGENFYPEMRWVLDNKIYFFLSAHDLEEVKITLQMWPNSKIVFLTNSYDFITNKRKNYNFTLQNEWEQLRGTGWPKKYPRNLQEYFQLDNSIIKELNEFYNNLFYNSLVLFDEEKFKQELSRITNSEYFKWDVEWFHNSNKVIEEVENLYHNLGVKEFDAKSVKTYFDLWYSNTV